MKDISSKALEALDIPIIVINPDYSILLVNKAFTKLVGLSKSEVLDRKCFEVVHGLGEPGISCPHSETLKTKKPTCVEIKEPSLNNRSFLALVSPILSEEGEVMHTVHTLIDISELKQTEQILYDSIRRLESLKEIAEITGSDCDFKTTFSRLGRALSRMIDFDRASVALIDEGGNNLTVFALKTKAHSSELDQGTQLPITSTCLKVVKGKKGIVRNDLTKSKEIPDQKLVKEGIRSSMIAPLVSQNNVIALLNLDSHEIAAYTTDDLNFLQTVADQIAPAFDRSLLYNSLLESEEKYRSLFESESDAILMVDLETLAILDSNPAAAKLYGYSKEEFIKLRAPVLSAEPERTKKVLKEKGAGYIPLRYHKKKNGTVFTVEISSAQFELHGKQVNISTIRDITEQKKAEELIRNAREELESRVKERTAELNKSNKNLLQEITERKKAEDALRVREHDLGERVKELNCLYEISKLSEDPDSSLDSILQGTVDIIPQSWQYPEITSGRIIFDGKEYLTENFVKGKWKQETEIIIKRKKRGKVSVFYTEEKPEIFEGPFLKEERNLINDITERLQDFIERKKAEEFLAELSQKNQLILDAAGEGIYGLDLEGLTTFVNPAAAKMIDWEVKDIIGKSQHDLLHHTRPDGTPYKREECPIYAAFTDGKVHHVKDEVFWRKDGSSFPVEYISTPIRDKDGKLSGAVVTFSDITVRKKAEELIRNAREELESRVKERTAELNKSHEKLLQEITERKIAEEKIRESEEKYRSLVETSQDLIWKCDAEGRFTYLNKAWETTHGYKVEEMLGRPFSEFQLPEVSKRDISEFQRHLEGGKVTDYETTHISKAGKTIHMIFNALPVQDSKGEIIGTQGTANDITDRKQAEQALMESEEKFRRAFEDSMIGMVLVNKNGRHVKVNESMTKILGYSQDEFLSKTVNDITYPGDTTTESKGVKKLWSGESNEFSTEKRYGHRDGHTIWGHVYVSPIRDSSGKTLYTLGQLTDITDRKHAEIEMKRRLMKYNLEDGSLYLVKESRHRESLLCSNDLLKIGYKGLVVSRTREKEIRKALEGDFEFLWLSETQGKKTVTPDLEKIMTMIEKHGSNSVVFVDRLDYLISKNGFKKTLGFVQRLAETVIINGPIVLLTIDPDTISKKELRLLEKEAKKPEPYHKTPLPEEFLEILRFLYEENNMGAKPSYTKIGSIIGASRPTSRKRIKKLITQGYARDSIKGNQKVVELTEKGRKMFTK